MTDETPTLKTMVTYRMADGDLIGDFSWVSDTEYFDDVDEPTDVIMETWLCTSSETITFKPANMLCTVCHGEGELVEELRTFECPHCHGDGNEP